jgi:Uma2 family endonuclease
MSNAPEQHRLLTAEEFAALPEHEPAYELIDGKLRQKKEDMPMSTAIKQQGLLTAEELAALPEHEPAYELIDGELHEKMAAAKLHGRIALKIGTLLWNWIEQQDIAGEAGIETGFILARNPDVVRLPDVHYISAERIAQADAQNVYWDVAPDLAVEVISPSETAHKVQEKLRHYLAAGTRLVWQVYPARREVVVHQADGSGRTCTAEETLEFPTVLPGFRCTVAELFA